MPMKMTNTTYRQSVHIAAFLVLAFIIMGFMRDSDKNAIGPKTKKLFQSDSILVLSLEMNLETVANDTKERNQHGAKLFYTQADGNVVNHAIKLKVRGNSRAFKHICTFPPLRLTFNKTDTKNSIFKGQKKVKLVTHCRIDESYEELYQKEYLVYKLYQKVSSYSFNVRLCEITYIDVNNPREANMHYGFLIEDIKHVAKRNNVHVYKDSLRNHELENKVELDKLIMFQYMIGNHDWSISKMHNIKLVKDDDGSLPIAVPYDFDYSGLVGTPYAVGPRGTDITDVKTRDFKGFCRQNGYYETIDFYKSIKEDILGEIENSEFLTKESRTTMAKYIKSFYKNLNNRKYVDTKINKACSLKHKHAYETN